MSLSGGPSFFTSAHSDKKRDAPATLYQHFQQKGYKQLATTHLKNSKENNILLVTLLAAFLSHVNEEDFADFNTLFIKAFGEENQIHAYPFWLHFQNHSSLWSGYASEFYSFDIFPTLMERYKKALNCNQSEQVEFEKKISADLHPNLCSDEAYLFNKICHKLNVKICILLSQSQQIIFGEQYKTEIVLIRQHSNQYYFLVSPKKMRLDDTLEFAKFELPVAIKHFEHSRKQQTFIPEFSSFILQSVYPFLHSANIDAEEKLIPLQYVSKAFKRNAQKYIHSFRRIHLLKEPIRPSDKDDDDSERITKLTEETLQTLITTNFHSSIIAVGMSDLDEATKNKTQEQIVAEATLTESKLSAAEKAAARQLTQDQLNTIQCVVLGKAAELKSFLEDKKNSAFNLNFHSELFVSLVFLNALFPNEAIQALLDQHHLELIPSSSRTTALQYVERMFYFIVYNRRKVMSKTLVSIFVRKLPDIHLLKNETNNNTPVVISFLHAGIACDLPILEEINYLMLLFNKSHTSLSNLNHHDNQPWILDFFRGEDVTIGNHSIDIIETALRHGLDQGFFTSDDPELIKWGIKCLHLFAGLPLRILKLFSTLYPLFYQKYLNEPAGDSQKTTLHCMACSDKQKNVTFLLENKSVDFTAKDKEGYNFFHHIVDNNRRYHYTKNQYFEYLELIKQLIAKYPILLELRTNTGLSPFLIAVKNLDYDLLELLEAKPIAQDKDEKGRTALHLAFSIKNSYYPRGRLLATVKILLARDYSVNALDQQNQTPIFSALQLLQKKISYSDKTINPRVIPLLKLIKDLFPLSYPIQFKLTNSDGRKIVDIIFELNKCYLEDLVLILLKQRKLLPDMLVNHLDRGKIPLLVYVTERRLTKILHYLLTQTDVNVNQVSDDGSSIFYRF